MIQFDGDILCVQAGIVCHTAGNRGLMTEKISQRIRDHWPMVKSEYLSAYIGGTIDLGDVLFTNVNIGKHDAENNSFMLQVATMVCENNCLTRIDGENSTMTDYQSFRKCLNKVSIWRKSCVDITLPVYIPFGIGCGQTRGDWRIIRTIIEKKIPTAIIIRESKYDNAD